MDNGRHPVPVWLEVLIMMGTGALAGATAATIMGQPIRARATGSAVTFGIMSLAWRVGTEAENKVRVKQGLPPVEPKQL